MTAAASPLRPQVLRVASVWGTTVLGTRSYSEHVVFATDPRGREYLWIGGAKPIHDVVPGSDTEAFDAGIASITPLVLDLSSSEGESYTRTLVASALA